MAIHMGYMGHARINGTIVFLTGSSLNPTQAIEAPDLVQGYWVKHAFNYGKVEIAGNLTGPVADNHGTVFQAAWDRTADGDVMTTANLVIDIAYYKGGGRTFNNCSINTYQITVNAGEVATFSIDFFGAATGVATGVSSYVGTITPTCHKLITWDRCTMDCSPAISADSFYSTYTVTVNNNLQRVYKVGLGTETLYPAAVMAGFRDVTGTISVYSEGNIHNLFPPSGGLYGADTYDQYAAAPTHTLSFQIGTPAVIDISGISARFTRPQASAQTGPQIYTFDFTGICYQD